MFRIKPPIHQSWPQHAARQTARQKHAFLLFFGARVIVVPNGIYNRRTDLYRKWHRSLAYRVIHSRGSIEIIPDKRLTGLACNLRVQNDGGIAPLEREFPRTGGGKVCFDGLNVRIECREQREIGRLLVNCENISVARLAQ